jgi:methyl-accepting chemotaxis protein
MRKNYLVKRRFQMNFILAFIVLLVLESLLIAGLFMHVSSDTLTTGYFNSTLRIERTPSYFLVPLILITAIVVGGIGITGMVVFILLSHRIAGPLYRFETILGQIERGDLTTRVDLRRTDQLAELKGSLNVFIDSLDGRMGKVKLILEEAKTLLSKKGDPETLTKLEAVIDRLKDEIEHFKVTSNSKE